MGSIKTGTRIVGFSQLRYGVITTIGTIPAALITLGNLVPGSAHYVKEPPTVTNIMVEDKSTPDVSISTDASQYLEFASRDLGTSMLILAFGGSVSGTTCYKMPATSLAIREFAFEAISDTVNLKKIKIQIARGSLTVGADLKFARNDTGQLNFKVEALCPDTSVAAYKTPCRIIQV